MATVSRIYVGVDLGEKRIGLAKSDPLGLLASPAKTLMRKGHSADVDSILRFASESGALEIVVGMPTSMSGESGPQAQRTAEFISSLSVQAHVPVRTQDERMSSVEAETMLRAAGKRPSRHKAAVDSAAAAIILQRFLDRLNSRRHRFRKQAGTPNL